MDPVTYVHPDFPGVEREVRPTPNADQMMRAGGWAPKPERAQTRRRSRPDVHTGAAEGGTEQPSEEKENN